MTHTSWSSLFQKFLVAHPTDGASSSFKIETMPPRCSLRRIWLASIGIHRRVSSASYFVECSAKLFEEGASGYQIGKAPARIRLIVSNNSPTVSWLKAPRCMKTYDLSVQFEFQSAHRNSKLDDIRIPALVDQLFATTGLSRHLWSPGNTRAKYTSRFPCHKDAS
jgi:hypothetical protein